MDDTITLYRGDFSKIDEFSFHKTNRHCLVGQGVYLTSSVVVANSYRDKGRKWWDKVPVVHGVVTLYDGKVEEILNRNNAHDAGFKTFCELMERAEHIPKNLTKKQRPDWLKHTYLSLRESGDVKADYYNVFRDSRRIRVTWDTKTWVGHLNQFRFARKQIANHFLNVDKPIYDRSLIELLWDEGIANNWMTTYATKTQYVVGNLGTILFRSGGNWPSLRRVVEPYGYKGFEYNGGKRIGGCGTHRAFCVWDAEWVNQHRL